MCACCEHFHLFLQFFPPFFFFLCDFHRGLISLSVGACIIHSFPFTFGGVGGVYFFLKEVEHHVMYQGTLFTSGLLSREKKAKQNCFHFFSFLMTGTLFLRSKVL